MIFNVTELPVQNQRSVSKVSKSLYKVVADLTTKNVAESVQFETELLKSVATADLIIDRTKFDIKYSSGSFFKNLGIR